MTRYDFGYWWPWTYGHLYLALLLAAGAVLGWRRLPWWGTGLLSAGTIWALAGFVIAHHVFLINAPLTLPTPNFLPAGQGQVLDIGCGSGRTTVMVGLARPGVHITALDNFSADYIKDNGEARLRQNLRVAGIGDERVTVLSADMRHIPLADASLDGVVSSYAIDHLDGEGIRQTLAEVSRILKPGGSFLLMVVYGDGWMKFTYGPLAHHLSMTPDSWPERLQAAGLPVVERGTTPGSAHYLCRKP